MTTTRTAETWVWVSDLRPFMYYHQASSHRAPCTMPTPGGFGYVVSLERALLNLDQPCQRGCWPRRFAKPDQ